ncbi:MAG TPA: hypothetical protein VK020_16075 [Microlunatus sp.]|nr:hypothetical protein [Microlunatus sp.]
MADRGVRTRILVLRVGGLVLLALAVTLSIVVGDGVGAGRDPHMSWVLHLFRHGEPWGAVDWAHLGPPALAILAVLLVLGTAMVDRSSSGHGEPDDPATRRSADRRGL